MSGWVLRGAAARVKLIPTAAPRVFLGNRPSSQNSTSAPAAKAHYLIKNAHGIKFVKVVGRTTSDLRGS